MTRKAIISDLGRVVTGNTPPRNQPELYGDYTPFIKATDISENEKHTYFPEEAYSESGYKKYIRSLIPKGSTCVVTIGSIGKKMTMAHCDCFINQAMNAIIPNEHFDNEYVYYAIKNALGNLKALDSGTASGRENVSKSAFSKMEVAITDDIILQKKIGSILATYDDLIENNRKQIKLLEESAQRLYKEWFVDLRFPGYEHTKIVDGVPEGWETLHISDVCDTIGGGTPSTKVKEYYQNGRIPWVTPTDITKNSSLVLLDTATKITNEGLNASSAKMVPPGTILMTSRASVGFFGICDFSVCTNQGFICCIPYQSDMQMYLLYNLLNRVDEIRGKAGGSTYLEISKKVFRDFEVVVPDSPFLTLFQITTEKFIEQTKILSKQILRLQQARDRLLPKLMSGEVKV